MLSLPEGTLANKRNITEHLVRQIVSGQIKENDALPKEIDCASLFGVSRSVIRDIFKSLEEKGLIERKTNSGTRIRNIQFWNLLDKDLLEWSSGFLTHSRFLVSLMELRLVIEPQAAALAARRANDSDLLKIRSCFSLMGRNPGALDSQADINFHSSIIGACGNLFIAQLGRAIQGALHHTIHRSNEQSIDVSKALDFHRKVIEGIESRDSIRAYSAMYNMLGNAMADLDVTVSDLVLAEPRKS